jgi:hypothetical protein
LISLLARIASLWKRNGENTKVPLSAKAKILSFPTAEARLDARIPDQLEVFESGGYIFVREPAGAESSSLHPIEAAVVKFWRVRAW